ncbi:MAG: transposase [Phycisphaerales bacterium]
MKKDKSKKPVFQVAKDALTRINLGISFAEYDPILRQRDVFVRTPALEAALDPSRAKCFFVGRRGTGKTAIALYLADNRKLCVVVNPQIFVPSCIDVEIAQLADTRQRPFKSLVTSFSRTFLLEAVMEWSRRKLISLDALPSPLSRDRPLIEDLDFDQRQMRLQAEVFESLNKDNEKDWLRFVNRAKDTLKVVDDLALAHSLNTTILIDRIDEAWDGSDKAVICLMGLMHTCVQLSATCKSVRALLFLRENIFERVRQIDNEFARLETSVVSLDWTQELLLELVERRLQLPLNPKPPIGGATWDCFFESGPSARAMVFDYCQERPRDVLTYCSFAVETAQSRRHHQVTIEDLQAARRRFSESRFKDLSDEYSENFPTISLVLSRFYGLGTEYTVAAVTAFIQKLLVDDEVKQACAGWIYGYVAPERFIELLYNIGFFGIRDGADKPQYRSLGVKSPTPPPITERSHVVVHPSYVDALALHETVIGALGDEIQLKGEGLVYELPDATSLHDYQARLDTLLDDMKTLPNGKPGASQWEHLIGETIRLCFFRSLANVEPKVRDVSGVVIRDWVTSNVAQHGFWEMVRQRYNATQVIWECKNYADLTADDFHQALYYMTRAGGRFVIVVFRGEIQRHYYEHVRRACEKDGMVLLLTERDIVVFLRQAKHGKIKESHIRDIYDRTIREIS